MTATAAYLRHLEQVPYEKGPSARRPHVLQVHHGIQANPHLPWLARRGKCWLAQGPWRTCDTSEQPA